MDFYIKNGEEIFLKFCNSPDNLHPTMLPIAPDQTYIDKYPESSPAFRDERKCQSDYEAEVVVYRAVEKLDEKRVIVLHNFEYTHHQYRLCDKDHVRKGCPECKNPANRVGECDFLVICPDRFIIIEVKNTTNILACEPDFHLCTIGEDWENPECMTMKRHSEVLNKTFKISLQQRQKILNLIECIDIEVEKIKNFEREFLACDPDFHLCTIDEDWENAECMTMKKHSEVLNKTFQKSLQQRHKIVNLIECLDKDIPILQFTACPNLSAKYREEFADQPDKNSMLRVQKHYKNSIIFKEDLDNFSAWWLDNVINNPLILDPGVNLPNNCENVRNTLLALWCTEKDKCDQSRCSLGQSILDISKRLKEGKFTFLLKQGKNRAQNRAQNPGVIKAPDVIRTNVKVENLTVEQDNAFKSKEPFLWINGPAGAGKTVILCGKILQLINSDSDNKVVVLKFAGKGNNSQHYQNALDNASIKYELISTSKRKHTPRQLAKLITKSMYNVVIVEITDIPDTTKLTDRLSVLSGYNLFVDDIQTVIKYDTTAVMWRVLISKLLELSANKTVWIACDLVQIWYIDDTQTIVNVANSIIDLLTPNQRATLTMNLRNTFDLSNILSEIRDQFVKSCSLKSNILDLVLPAQSAGHFIHGPLPVIHVFNDRNVNSIGSVFNTELDRLCATLNYSDIGIIYTDYSSDDVLSLVRNSVDMRCVNTDSKIAVCYSKDCASSEWPAVIVVHEVWRSSVENDLTELYLTLSRARVYCSVVIYPEKGRTLDSYPYMLTLLDKLSNYARIIRH